MDSRAPVSIRRAANDDAPVIAALWTEAYVETPGGGRDEPYSEQDVLDSADAGDVIVAERNLQVVGAVVLMPAESARARVASDGELEISRLAVAYTTRRAGIARALMYFCYEQAARRQCDAIVLWTRPTQREAHRLYQSLGYQRLPRRDTTDRYGRCLVYRLPLPRNSS